MGLFGRKAKDNAISKNSSIKQLNEQDLLNIAMKLCLEWEENWLRPINNRLKNVVPTISDDEAERIDKYIRGVREDIYSIVEQYYIKRLPEEEVRVIVRDKYPFLDNDNYAKVFSQGMYYAWREYGG